MKEESIEDTYDWLDTDENYPLDPTHIFGWKHLNPHGVGNKPEWLRPYCTEHDHIVRAQPTASPDSSDEERREWITENRSKLVKECQQQEERKQRQKTEPW